ncbi:MAG: hypothetical protein ACOX0M_00405 [Salinivirgaceae bacterium]|jgi:hypothetical protein|nr:hypothetical protein [Bacteroidales bacterium]
MQNLHIDKPKLYKPKSDKSSPWLIMTALLLVLLLGVQFISSAEINNTLSKFNSSYSSQHHDNYYFSVYNIGFLQHALKNEVQTSFSHVNFINHNAVYKSLNGLLPTIARPEPTVGVEYLYFTSTIIINPRKADKLFPFHCFW